MLWWCWCSGWRRDYEIGVEPPGKFSATLAACGSSSTFFVEICDTIRLQKKFLVFFGCLAFSLFWYGFDIYLDIHSLLETIHFNMIMGLKLNLKSLGKFIIAPSTMIEIFWHRKSTVAQ